MKVESHKAPEGFKPVTINITLESQLELDIFGSLFNCGRIANMLRELGLSQDIWAHIEKQGGNVTKYTQDIHKGLRLHL